jgi:signal transduction histidine kinase
MRRIPLVPAALAAATLLVLLAFFGIVRQNLQQMRTLREETDRIEHTLQVQRELDAVLLYAAETDSTSRGFLITASDVSFGEYQQAKEDLQHALDRLNGLTRDNRAQQSRIDRLRAAITARTDGLDRAIGVRRAKGLDAAIDDARASDTNRWRADIRALAGEMVDEENALLSSRRVLAEQAYTRAVNGRVGSGIVSAVLLVGLLIFYFGYARSSRRRELALVESERRAREAAAREQEARAEAERANRLKDDFLAVLSHELRTPLNAVLGWAQIVQAASPRDPTIVRALASIKRNAEAQQRLVEDLLDVSRIVTGKFPLDRHPFDLQTAVAAAVDAIRPSAAAKNIQLDVAIDSAAQIEGDPDRIQQVAANLLSNAVKFTPQGGHISVMLAPANGRARLTVCDTGEGIAPDLKPHIFDRFRQGDGSSTRAHGGLGLGLAIAKHIVDAHGGSIVASSDGPGKGSTFSVELPVP